MNNLEAYKMDGLGNDFIIFDNRKKSISLSKDQIVKISDRNNIGCDQVIFIDKDESSNAFLKFYNSDGGEISACGNGSRCVAYLLMKENNSKKISLRTKVGILQADLNDKNLLNNLVVKLEDIICLHVDKQIEAGANVIQLFDSWAGLLSKDDLYNYCYSPTLKIVNHIKKKGIPIICFPKGIKKEDYREFCSTVKPNAISIDYEIDPEWIKNKANNLPIQGGLDPKILLTSKENIKKNVDHYLNIFSGYPYIFNLGHGVLPETDPNMVRYIIDIIREKKA